MRSQVMHGSTRAAQSSIEYEAARSRNDFFSLPWYRRPSIRSVSRVVPMCSLGTRIPAGFTSSLLAVDVLTSLVLPRSSLERGSVVTSAASRGLSPFACERLKTDDIGAITA